MNNGTNIEFQNKFNREQHIITNSIHDEQTICIILWNKLYLQHHLEPGV